MKYIIIPYLALGLVLSTVIGIHYSCSGAETFPEYVGSPFVFRQKSLGSSMTYYYSVSGVLLNVAVWSSAILLIQKGIHFLIQKTKNQKPFVLVYRGFVVALIALSTLFITFGILTMGRGFEKGRNYWHFNLNEESNIRGMECEGKWSLFSDI